MNAGERDQMLVFQRAPKPFPVSPSGEPMPVFSDEHRCWGSVRPLSGSEGFAAQQVTALSVDVFNVRDPGEFFEITPDESLRIVNKSNGDRAYDILRVTPTGGRRAELEIIAQARAESMSAVA